MKSRPRSHPSPPPRHQILHRLNCIAVSMCSVCCVIVCHAWRMRFFVLCLWSVWCSFTSPQFPSAQIVPHCSRGECIKCLAVAATTHRYGWRECRVGGAFRHMCTLFGLGISDRDPDGGGVEHQRTTAPKKKPNNDAPRAESREKTKRKEQKQQQSTHDNNFRMRRIDACARIADNILNSHVKDARQTRANHCANTVYEAEREVSTHGIKNNTHPDNWTRESFRVKYQMICGH